MITATGKIILTGTFKITTGKGETFTVAANTFHRAAQLAANRLCGFGAEVYRIEGEQGRAGKFKAYNNANKTEDAVFMVEGVTETQ